VTRISEHKLDQHYEACKHLSANPTTDSISRNFRFEATRDIGKRPRSKEILIWVTFRTGTPTGSQPSWFIYSGSFYSCFPHYSFSAWNESPFPTV